MAVDMYLEVDGIQGESADRTRRDTIDVLSWNWGLTQHGTTQIGAPGGGGSGKVDVSDITLTKWVDKATPDLIKACTSGKHIKKATLYVRKAGGDAPIEYFKIQMETIIVSSYSTGGAANSNDQIMETLTLNFRKFVMTYTQQDEAGGAAAASDAGWDVAENVAYLG